MEKNTVLAIVLATGFLIIWYLFVQPKRPMPPVIEPLTQTAESSFPSSQIKQPIIPSAAQKPLISSIENKEKELVVETPLARIVFSNNGAGIVKWEIKDIAGWVNLVFPHERNQSVLATSYGTIFSAESISEGKIVITDLYKDISFSAATAEGVHLTKTYRIYPDQYMIDVALTVSNSKLQPVSAYRWDIGWGPGLNTTARELKENKRNMRAIGFVNNKIVKENGVALEGKFDWAAVDNRYFLAALIPQSYEDFSYLEIKTGKKVIPQFKWHMSTDLRPGEAKKYAFKMYVGPKGYSHLRQLGYKLEESVNFGFFGFLGKFALRSLLFFHKHTGNYGWSIILLTGCLQFFFIPLTLKSFKANLAMKKLQPQIKQLQAKYKSDPKRLNMETMNLYKSSGTNPFGGCLPMILQIPVFWALFTTLRNAVELRGSPFIFWIKDLSIHDPIYVLPILMGLGMLLQQKTMSVSADPNQAKIMMFMPVIFTFFFLKFPAGLVLYWFTNSLLTMSVQFIMMRKKKTAAAKT